MKKEEKAIRFLMSYFNASEFEDSRDEFTESWVAVAGCLKAYAEQVIQSYSTETRCPQCGTVNPKITEAEQENKELMEALEEYGAHQGGCPKDDDEHHPLSCTCGLEQALKR
jgi:heterodisulfide reductase subunit B